MSHDDVPPPHAGPDPGPDSDHDHPPGLGPAGGSGSEPGSGAASGDPWTEAFEAAGTPSGPSRGAALGLLGLGLCALVWLGVSVGGCLFRGGRTYHVRLTDATGLEAGAPVRWRGHPIGEVVSVRVLGRDLIAELRLERDAGELVRKDARWRPEAKGVLDAQREVVLADPGSGEAAPEGHGFDADPPGLVTRLWTPAVALLVLIVACVLLLRLAPGLGGLLGLLRGWRT